MTLALVFADDAVEKMLPELTPTERVAVTDLMAALEIEPRQGEQQPGYDPNAEEYIVRLTPKRTAGRGISVVYRFHPYMASNGACLLRWLIIGP
ncbi:hypothetical protein [Kitasatospora kifunensis]|uniref:Uncharacterized protein n=1 Tax=Kitasatospora kifunensis TaxID=58351 RepID=A0A7W7RBX1_KITKI|nr:hypothetical protein [Kitasatospora kifunensis]MBB4929089.1 hypothetical protein [Kitasatospora kifunensis]